MPPLLSVERKSPAWIVFWLVGYFRGEAERQATSANRMTIKPDWRIRIFWSLPILC
jgi:hypothetical protein